MSVVLHSITQGFCLLLCLSGTLSLFTFHILVAMFCSPPPFPPLSHVTLWTQRVTSASPSPMQSGTWIHLQSELQMCPLKLLTSFLQVNLVNVILVWIPSVRSSSKPSLSLKSSLAEPHGVAQRSRMILGSFLLIQGVYWWASGC